MVLTRLRDCGEHNMAFPFVMPRQIYNFYARPFGDSNAPKIRALAVHGKELMSLAREELLGQQARAIEPSYRIT
jgi:hypothetical protein